MRLLVPDVARGLALLGIALANAPTVWFIDDKTERADFFGGATTTLDDATVIGTAVTTHMRGLPMFSTLLGFGIGLIALSLWKKGFPLPQARKVLLKRYGFLAVLGALHSTFIFVGDIMFYYGMCGMLFAALLTVSNKVLKRFAYAILTISVVGSILLAALSGGSLEEIPQSGLLDLIEPHPDTYGGLVLENFLATLLAIFVLPLMAWDIVPVMLIGFVWARQGTLTNPTEHRRELYTWLVLGAIIAFGVGIPWGLGAIGVLPENIYLAFEILNLYAGVLTGPAILAFLTLILHKTQERVNAGARVPLALRIPAALGKRSMSGYIFQSLAFAVVAYPFMLGLDLDAFGMAVVATTIWVISLALAWGWEMAGWRGPFEILHRRLSYGPAGTPQLTSNPHAPATQNNASQAIPPQPM
ncbi:hypothetical protein CPHO_01230 [Corynebacterium phocae]|uniref:DUF418 domain-containing protein n=1 Tax=Corynebacterium phocae TaxID=161895 RepID=A0A1L7D100_9CORY|nr:DUF418 domain-containing protein [Corynebacterium phocae]APT91768.1 hypothetical protein CPHO_01230 [Corynebacterium phocae]KAA8728537.1 DUF418 domain-containing protein [Corynebacterium phocae]